MFIPVEKSKDKTTNYERLLDTLPHYIDQKDPWYTVLSNASAIIDYFLDEINWIGFYVNEEDALYLGPFQGVAACTKIHIGHGVCGTAAEKRETVKVDDVEAFPGHITCDADSKSEIVVPLIREDVLLGVLDIDSPVLGRFDETDRDYLEKAAALIVDKI